MKTGQAFRAADCATLVDGVLMPTTTIHMMDADCTIMRDLLPGEEIEITPFKEFMQFHAAHGWNIPSPFDAVSANG